MNAKFSLTSFSLTSFICWCEQINKFSLTRFHCVQQYNYTVDEKKITTTRRQFRFFIIAYAYLTRGKRLLARGRSCALLMQYEHLKRHKNRRWWVRPRATQIFLPHFTYCSTVWMHCGKTASDKLEKMNKRALRKIFNDNANTYTTLLDIATCLLCTTEESKTCVFLSIKSFVEQHLLHFVLY